MLVCLHCLEVCCEAKWNDREALSGAAHLLMGKKPGTRHTLHRHAPNKLLLLPARFPFINDVIDDKATNGFIIYLFTD